jgi:acid ceramidase
MTMIPELTVDLEKAPRERWVIPPIQKTQAKELLASYLRDLDGWKQFRDLLVMAASSIVEPEYLEEIAALSGQLQRPRDEVLIGNLYYDALKFVFGCTAFAVDTQDGPLHARNLDWWTENDMLRRFTTVTHYTRGGQRCYSTVGWPGYIGALSGIAHGRFAVTLNAALSSEPGSMSKPISLFIRTVLEHAADYAEAVQMLTDQPIASDCLLLVTGTKMGEMCVIERTPTRSAVRQAQNGYVTVTNDYLAIRANGNLSLNDLLSTSCGRYDRACERLARLAPESPDECFAVLSDPRVKMQITVQQMVFSARRGLIDVRLPN